MKRSIDVAAFTIAAASSALAETYFVDTTPRVLARSRVEVQAELQARLRRT